MRTLTGNDIPDIFKEIPQPPKTLYIQGVLPPEGTIYLTVVGSRKHTSYGMDVTRSLIRGLAGYPIAIVSGLALGIDTIAHQTALEAGLTTIAFPGSGLNNSILYPAENKKLRDAILEAGGAVVSEFPPMLKATNWSFPQRNRLMAGIAKATLVIEAAEKSGTLITARLALDYNRDVLVVPGPITSTASVGTNKLLRLGATPILRPEDILEALGFEVADASTDTRIPLEQLTSDERAVLEILREPTERDELARALGKPIHEISATLSILEIQGFIKEEMGEVRRI